MDDLISRQAALKAVSWDTEAYMAINMLPSAQKTGRWKGEGLGDYRCSLCGEITRHTRTRYCPNCGADMR